jgi:hypothetical protein
LILKYSPNDSIKLWNSSYASIFPINEFEELIKNQAECFFKYKMSQQFLKDWNEWKIFNQDLQNDSETDPNQDEVSRLILLFLKLLSHNIPREKKEIDDDFQ